MYELVQVSEKCYYINCPAKIGVYVADKDNVYLVDSGNDKDAGRKVRQILEKNGWHLVAILNTHSNADHIGGNKYLQGIPLPGHFFDMVGFRMPDNVVFLADCISSRETLDKYAVSFIYDVEAYLKTLDMVEGMEAAMFVPAHADASAALAESIIL